MAAYARDSDADTRPEVWTKQIESIFLRAYCRPPSDAETKFWIDYLNESPDTTEGFEDMVWAIMNSREFVMNH